MKKYYGQFIRKNYEFLRNRRSKQNVPLPLDDGTSLVTDLTETTENTVVV